MSYLSRISRYSMFLSRSMHSPLTSHQNWPLNFNSLFKICSSTCPVLAPGKGMVPQSIWYKMTPRLQISLLKSLGCLRSISGDLYPSVPVSCWKHSSSSRKHARPKSAILTFGVSLLLLRMMFLCLMSRCTTYAI